MAEEMQQANLSADADAVIPRLKLSESGTTGLTISNKQILEEANRLFQFPQFIKVVDEMRNDATVASALLAYRTLFGRVDWSIEPPIGATQQQKDRAKFIETCLTDMEHSWGSFITEVCTYLDYGFAIHEKVFRRRLKANLGIAIKTGVSDLNIVCSITSKDYVCIAICIFHLNGKIVVEKHVSSCINLC